MQEEGHTVWVLLRPKISELKYHDGSISTCMICLGQSLTEEIPLKETCAWVLVSVTAFQRFMVLQINKTSFYSSMFQNFLYHF